MNAYEQGFISKCNEYGINPHILIKMAKSPIFNVDGPKFIKNKVNKFTSKYKVTDKIHQPKKLPDYHVDDPPMSPRPYGNVGQAN